MTGQEPAQADHRSHTGADQLPDAVAAFAEAALRALHVDALLEHIPVFKTTLAAASVVGSVRDHLLLKKIEGYLHAIAVLPAAERRDMVSRLSADATFDENLGEYLIELLDRIDGRRKPAMIGAVFAAYAFEQIDIKELLRLNLAIQALPALEIDSVRSLHGAERLSAQAIANAGLAEPQEVSGRILYELNATGAKFLELELDAINPVRDL